MIPENIIPNGSAVSDSRNPWVTRVYIVDDHRFFTFALTSLINCEADLTVCGSGADQETAMAEISRLAPDIVVIDVNLSQQQGLSLASALRQVTRGVPIVFVSSMQNPQFEVDSRWLEPCSFVEKTKDPTDIITGVRQTLEKFRLFQRQLPTNP
jgi:DNA-binding NarL/FixJ family response regulator